MNITINATSKEIADLLLEIENRLNRNVVTKTDVDNFKQHLCEKIQKMNSCSY